MEARGITIDGRSTKDRDDAVWVDSDARGWTVTVCISNVAAAISKGSPYDKSAARRVETAYMRDRNNPMIPRRFSEGLCSLSEGQTRRVVAIRMKLDHSLKTEFVSISEAKLISKKQFAYADIPQVLDDKNHQLHKEVTGLALLSNRLMKKRRNAGAFVLYDLSTGWMTSEDGSLKKLSDTKETVGHIIVQELMILANTEFAKYCAQQDIPIIFRNHTARSSAPDRQKMMERIELGLTSPVTNLDIVRQQMYITMNKAEYGTVIDGHYGLNLPAYTHATSPIRRYADLVNQRQIVAHVSKKSLPYTIEDLEEISAHINKTLLEKSEDRSQYEVDKANGKAKISIDKNQFSALKGKEFSRVVKVAARSGKFNKFVADEIASRLPAGTLTAIDLYTVLFEAGDEWEDVHKIIVNHMAKNPHDGTAVMHLAAVKEGWGEPKFQTRTFGKDGTMSHSAIVSFPKLQLTSMWFLSSNKKIAKHKACVDLVTRKIGLGPVLWEENENEKVEETKAD